jgi:hypothetical protein
MPYFNAFPQIPYDIAGRQFSNYENVTNIFFRLGIIREVLGNISAYYEYVIREDDTPEMLAEKIYDDPEAHWIILMANSIVDPQFDWPMNSVVFNNYIIGKYGSIANAKTSIHHYEKVITREESKTGLITETRFVVNKEKLTNNSLTVPYDYYQGVGSLPETQLVETFDMPDGGTVVQITRREDITNYDYEEALNEAKRNIKIIKPEYYGQIMAEFDQLTEYATTPYLRRLI